MSDLAKILGFATGALWWLLTNDYRPGRYEVDAVGRLRWRTDE